MATQVEIERLERLRALASEAPKTSVLYVGGELIAACYQEELAGDNTAGTAFALMAIGLTKLMEKISALRGDMA
jgi:hypothetical protein